MNAQAGSHNEPVWDETACDEAADNLNWPGQPGPEDSRYFDSSQLNGGEVASDDQYPTYNSDSPYLANTTAHDGISLEPPINLPWQPPWPDLELNSVPIDPNLYQANYATTPLYSGFHEQPLVGSSSLPLNYYRQPENQHLCLSPSVPSAQSAPSDGFSAHSAPFSPFAGTYDETILTSYLSGTHQQSSY
ncbi:hypothetical protein E8E14_008873 [Neopestalotiopsis sp. 37M]|nr:hypothetical protein E8E14_008873 [Neopestalotiopsis sp. 37M]